MRIAKTKNFLKTYQKLPKFLQKKVDKQIRLLEKNFYYPSLRTKKLEGFEDWWEFRVDYHNRMIGKKIDDLLVLYAVGPHDRGLGKK